MNEKEKTIYSDWYAQWTDVRTINQKIIRLTERINLGRIVRDGISGPLLGKTREERIREENIHLALLESERAELVRKLPEI